MCSREYRLIRRFRIFDSGYYLSLAGKAEKSIVDPLWDYLICQQNDIPTNERSGGWQQLADPHPLFDTWFYLHRYFWSKGCECTGNPFAHYLDVGWKQGHEPGPFFTTPLYAERSGWNGEQGDPLSHYVHYGMGKKINPGQAFDIDFFLDANPVLRTVGNEIIKHYKLHGQNLAAPPLPVFDRAFYLSQLADSTSAAVDPLSHYLTMTGEGGSGNEGVERVGQAEPGEWFHSDQYNKEAEEAEKVTIHDSAFIHYLTRGVHLGYVADPRVKELAYCPKISIVVPVYNPDLGFLANCIRSVLYQAYPHWELCLVDDCSSRDDVRQTLESWAAKDPRIKIGFLPENSGIAAATNAAIELATGEYIGFLDNDDELTVDCLYYVASAIGVNGADLVYTDEDLIGNDGSRLSVFRKPGFNEQLLLSHNYITHFVVTSRSLLLEAGKLDSNCDGAQDYDLILRLSEKAKQIVHIPEILYHWRASETSTSINHGEKSYAHDAGTAALKQAFQRRELKLVPKDTGLNYYYHYELPDGVNSTEPAPSVTVIVLPCEGRPIQESHLQSLVAKTTTQNAEFIVCTSSKENVTTDDDTVQTVAKLTGRAVSIYRSGEEYGISHAFHRAAVESTHEYIAFITLPDSSEGVGEWLSKDWLEQLLLPFTFAETGVVCGRVLFGGKDGESYALPNFERKSALYYHNYLCNYTRHANGLHCQQEVPLCGWELALLPRKTYLGCGGFDFQNYSDYFAMADLTMRLRVEGNKILYTPYATIDIGQSFIESAVIAEDDKMPADLVAAEARNYFQQRWHSELVKGKGFYNHSKLLDEGFERSDFLSWFAGPRPQE